MIGCAQFVIFTFLGMLFYAGGTYLDPSILGYSFDLNFFSDIGRTVAHSGNPNTISFIFFTLAFLLVGVLLVPSFLAFPYFFMRKKLEKWLTIAGSFMGLFTAFCLSGIIFAPSDINGPVHVWFVIMGFTSGFIVAILYTITISLNKSYPKRYAFNFMVFAVFLGAYLVLLFTGPKMQTIEGLMIQVIGQKIILYTFAICLFIHGYGAWKQEKALNVSN